jgi:PadR family transcriptional regulator, regulatory protein PadR
MKKVRATLAVVRVLRVFLANPDAPQYGYGLMKITNFDSGKVYGILARLHDAGWLERTREPDPESGGPARVRYWLRPDGVEMARALVAEADDVPRTEPALQRRRGRGLAWGGAS